MAFLLTNFTTVEGMTTQFSTVVRPWCSLKSREKASFFGEDYWVGKAYQFAHFYPYFLFSILPDLPELLGGHLPTLHMPTLVYDYPTDSDI